MSMLKGFKEFILRGNVIDLAIGVVMGAAFNTVISSLVKDVLTPLIAAIAKQPDFSSMSFTIHGSKFMYGDFLNAAISFLIMAFTLYFFVVLPVNRFLKRFRKTPNVDVVTKQCPECLSEIPLHARRCAHCTTILITP